MTLPSHRPFRRVLAAAATGLCLWAATAVAAEIPPAPSATTADDPLESFNRAMFGFNRALVLDVVAPTMDTVGPYVPDAVGTGLHNAYSNLTEIEFIINGALRRDLHGMAVPTGRFLVNSTVGVAGLFDVATPLGLERQESDFIESACQVGVPPGRYLVLPLVGPASLNYALLIAGGAAIQIYAFSQVSYALVAFDVVTDLGVAAGGLRYTTTAAEAGGDDPYVTLRDQHQSYVHKGCGEAPQTALKPARVTAGEVVATATTTPPPVPFRRRAGPPPVPRSLAERLAPVP